MLYWPVLPAMLLLRCLSVWIRFHCSDVAVVVQISTECFWGITEMELGTCIPKTRLFGVWGFILF